MSGNTIIIDPANQGNTAEVNSERQLSTRAVTFSSSTEATRKENQYVISPPVQVITGGAAQSILYCKNNESVSWELTVLNVSISENTTGKEWYLEVYVNDRSSAINISGIPFDPSPLNLGSSKTLVGIFNYINDGSAFAGSPSFTRLVSSTTTEKTIPLDSAILRPGSSLGLQIIPPVGNVSLIIDASFTVVRETA